ncbi:MAG: HesA/MoeB/ThiF family protein [Desulfurococcaceae archaeon]
MSLSHEELVRYDRQIKLIGKESQERLSRSKVLIVGIGGLGSVVSLYLTAAGVGELFIVDSERVELSNLNRQIIYTTRDINRLKVEVAAGRLKELNPHVNIRAYPARASKELLEELLEKVDLAIDCTDNWETRLMLNDVAIKHRKPFIHAGVHGFHGQLLVVVPGVTPCLRCILPGKPADQGEIPVLGTTPGIIGLLQATEAIKILTGTGTPLLNKLLIYDGFHTRFHEVIVYRNPRCPACKGLT